MQEAIHLSFNGMTLRGMEHVPPHAPGEKLPAVILFHGFTSNKLEQHRLFWKLSRELEEAGVAAFRYDFLGSGESDGHFEDMTVSGEIAEAHAILDSVRQDLRIDPTRIVLLGMSMGGLVASVVAGDRPQDLRDLVLLCPAGNMYDIVKPVVDMHLANPELKVLDYGGNLIGRAFGEDVRVMNVYDRAKNYTGEVLLVHGTRDSTVPFTVSQRYIETCYGDRAELHPIEGADHTYNKHEWEREVLDTVVARVKKIKQA
ncbi:alpha/beta fold hydrolase [Tumebacillus sp. ITR2]|uniref:Alpha/beta fold hydrolase n=1 Tax=Tumebacillus amylolyticus TaxID=2801339 RepID=A0ABS1JF56_9BACL|nr:alpha/beta fold hydrolase [Tumebacillus amylolyticus]MBL0388198.1 alpha/beta fold hydrolase [Tumebacillus amylolyticus]